MLLQTIVATTCVIYSLVQTARSQPIYSGNTQLENSNEVTITIDYDSDLVEIIFICFDPLWNGIGFGEQMNNSYAIITDYGEVDRALYEVILGHHYSGEQVDDAIIGRISDTTDGTTRTVHMARAINADYYSFPPQPEASSMEIPMIAALGTSLGFFLPGAGHTSEAHEQFTLTLDRIGTTSAPLITSTEMETTEMETTEMETTEMETTEMETTETLDVCCDCVSQMKYGEPCPKAPGCEQDTACENIICESDPYCCDKRWDKICSIQAQQVCDGNELPKCCGCSYKRNERVIGCDHDEACEEEVCSDDAFCCGEDYEGAGYWDHKCRKKAKCICKEVAMEKVDMEDRDVMNE